MMVNTDYHFKVTTQPDLANYSFNFSPYYFLPFFIMIGALSTMSLAYFNPKFKSYLITLITLIFWAGSTDVSSN